MDENFSVSVSHRVAEPFSALVVVIWGGGDGVMETQQPPMPPLASLQFQTHSHIHSRQRCTLRR